MLTHAHVQKRGPDKRCKMAELPTLDKRRVSKTELNEKIKKRESDLKTQTKGCNESHNSYMTGHCFYCL